MRIEYEVAYEFAMESITKYINNKLKKDVRVKEWGFAIDTVHNNALVVRIDYINNFHSRNRIEILPCDEDAMKRTFDMYLDMHFEELRLKVEKEDRIY